ncbi:MAG: hypothetical protein L0Y72_23605 [Gemmataceae bacterium]|nr:hypothetical protein [Gemmataceae bacterium]MCI0742031.1 hypothetical protein [Gemmataceae bacterium]
MIATKTKRNTDRGELVKEMHQAEVRCQAEFDQAKARLDEAEAKLQATEYMIALKARDVAAHNLQAVEAKNHRALRTTRSAVFHARTPAIEGAIERLTAALRNRRAALDNDISRAAASYNLEIAANKRSPEIVERLHKAYSKLREAYEVETARVAEHQGRMGDLLWDADPIARCAEIRERLGLPADRGEGLL